MLYSVQRKSETTWTIFRGQICRVGERHKLNIGYKTISALDLYRELKRADIELPLDPDTEQALGLPDLSCLYWSRSRERLRGEFLGRSTVNGWHISWTVESSIENAGNGRWTLLVAGEPGDDVWCIPDPVVSTTEFGSTAELLSETRKLGYEPSTVLTALRRVLPSPNFEASGASSADALSETNAQQRCAGTTLFPVLRGGRIGYIDGTGRVVIEPKFPIAPIAETFLPYFMPGAFSEGLAPISMGDLYGFINRDGFFVIPPRFHSATGFQEGRSAVDLG